MQALNVTFVPLFSTFKWTNLKQNTSILTNNNYYSPGIELDVRRYIAALLAALHLATVTRHQQQQESSQAAPPALAEPRPPAPTPPQAQETVPPTSDQVKPTPEGKSQAPQENSQME